MCLCVCVVYVLQRKSDEDVTKWKQKATTAEQSLALEKSTAASKESAAARAAATASSQLTTLQHELELARKEVILWIDHHVHCDS